MYTNWSRTDVLEGCIMDERAAAMVHRVADDAVDLGAGPLAVKPVGTFNMQFVSSKAC